MSDSEDFKREYHRYTFRKILVILVVVAGTIILAGISCTISGREMTFLDGINAIFNHILGNTYEFNTPQWWDDYVVWKITMPRVMGAIVAGAGLALCGCVMQTILRNPLAEPYTVGVSSGAVFGACLAIVLGFNVVNGLSQFGVIVNAFIFGLVPAMVIIFLSSTVKIGSPVTMILAGVAISYFFSGFTTLMLVTTDDEKLQDAYSWQVGSLDIITWNNVWMILAAVILSAILIMLLTKYLNAIAMGDKTAISLGVDVDKIRTVSLILTTIIVAVILSFTGIIGFVGLVAPHIIRLILGGDNKFVIPGGMAMGALVLLFADTITRFLTNVDVPVGAVMMFLGSPMFLYLLLSQRSRRSIY